MVELLQDKDIVITSNEIRNQILKELTNKKIMLNLKFYTLNEFMKEYYGTYGKEFAEKVKELELSKDEKDLIINLLDYIYMRNYQFTPEELKYRENMQEVQND